MAHPQNFSPVDTLWVNAHLATMAPGTPYGEIPHGALAVKNGKIAWAGPEKDLPQDLKTKAEKVENAGGRWITPGLVDCHTHLVYAGSRHLEFELRLKGATYEQIARRGGGIISTVKATREASESELLTLSEKRLLCLAKEGVTTVEIKSGYGLDLDTELKMLRVARSLGRKFPVDVFTTFLGAHALPPEYRDHPDDYVDFVCQTVLPQAARENLADAVDAFCENIAFSPVQVKKVFDAAKSLGLPVKLHAEQLSDSGGAALAAGFRALSADHLEHVSEKGAKAMADAGTVAVLLPGAYYFLKETRKPPVDLLRKHKVSMALATDANPGSSPTGSLLLMMSMGCVFFGLTPQEALAGVTRNAAMALGAGDRAGTLETGKQADFVVWDISHPAQLSYGFGVNPAGCVVKNGRKTFGGGPKLNTNIKDV